MAAVRRGVRDHASNWNDWDRNRKLVVVLMMLLDDKALECCWNDKSGADNGYYDVPNGELIIRFLRSWQLKTRLVLLNT